MIDALCIATGVVLTGDGRRSLKTPVGRLPPGSRVLIPDDGGPVATVQPYRKDALLIPVLDDFGMPHDYPPSALKIIWSPGMV